MFDRNIIVKIGVLLLVVQGEACLDLLVRSFNEIFTPVIETSESRVRKSHHVDDLTRFYKRDENGNFVLRDDRWLDANPFVKDSETEGDDEYELVGRSMFEHLNLAGKSLSSEEDEDFTYPWTDYEVEQDGPPAMLAADAQGYLLSVNKSIDTNASASEQNVTTSGRSASTEDDDLPPKAKKLQFAVQNQDYDYGDDYPAVDDDLYPYGGGRKPRYYVPGDRPLVDFLIKILEMFQVGLEATPNYILPHLKDKLDRKSKTKIKFRSSNESNYDDGDSE